MLWILPFAGVAQNGLNSPYTRYGLGEIYTKRNASTFGMGGISAGLRSPLIVNTSNPASLTAIDSKAFLFDVGMAGVYSQLTAPDFAHETGMFSLSGMSFAFPISKCWFSSLSLQPYSRMSYDISEQDSLDDGTNLGRTYSGSGGLNIFSFSNAFKLGKYFSVAGKISYLFGSLDLARELQFPSSSHYFSLAKQEKNFVGGISCEFGFQAHIDLKEKYFVNAGATFSNQQNIRSLYSVTSLRYDYLSDINKVIKDTIEFEEDQKGTMVLPLSFNAGFTAGIKDKLLFGVDFSQTAWEDFVLFEGSDSMQNSSRISVGIEYVPNVIPQSSKSAVGKYLRKMHYTAGFHIENGYFSFGNEQMQETGISFGLGLPVARFPKYIRRDSFIYLGVQTGKKGTSNEINLSEKYIRFTIGFTLYSNWFIRPKFD